jgi:protein involved in polysaccharide export with SLBB domain
MINATATRILAGLKATWRPAHFVGISLVFGAMLVLAGCSSPNPSSGVSPHAQPTEVPAESRLRTGDQIQVRVDAGPTTGGAQNYDLVVDENGNITLPLIGTVRAVGSTSAELAERIQANYVPRFYIRCHVNVLTSIRFFYVGGEVRSPGRYPWVEDTTVLKALNTAGGFTDYSNRKRVELVRGTTKRVVDCDGLRANPERDIAILPGDSIWVPRGIF